jgi:transcriptional regulator with XRE-family HTH domain
MDHELTWVFTATELGQAVKHARTVKTIRQGDLAELLGVSRMTISRLERGDAVNMETVMRALSECGYALVVAPKFVPVRIDG